MIETLPIPAHKGLRLTQLRIDMDRDTGIMATRNIENHIYVTLGQRREATLIMHPHAAKRLIAEIEEVLAGEDWNGA